MTYDPDTSVAQLAAELPIALLPVRLETRFALDAQPQPLLKLRIYPDELAADSHDPRLTAAERDAGHGYWTASWVRAAEPDAWLALVRRHAARAAWIVHATMPSNEAQRPAGAPLFPATPLRDFVLPTAVTRVLPDAWLAIAYRGGAEVARAVGAAIVEPLQLAFRGDLADGAPGMFETGGLVLEPELAWTIDFDRALAAGMALAIPLSGDDVAHGFDRVIVVGVKAALAPAAAAGRLGALLDAHHHTRGLALVRQGTPTSSTAAGPSGYPGPDDPARRFAIERGPDLAAPGTDGARLGAALGLAPDVLQHVDGADRTEDANAAAMSEALWPCTLGYYLEQLMAPAISAATIADVRVHARDFVRGRGPLPAFRVGRVPYGVLPVTAIARWASDPGAPSFEEDLRDLLVAWRAQLGARAAAVPRVGLTADPDADLLGALARNAASREVRLREVHGPAYTHALLALHGNDPAVADGARAAMVLDVLAAAGLGGTGPRLAGVTLGDRARRIHRPLVDGAPLSEDAALADNYIAELRDAKIDDLRDAADPAHPAFGRPLLYHLLRQGALLAYDRCGLAIAIDHDLALPAHAAEPEFVGIALDAGVWPTAWDRFALTIPAVTRNDTLAEWLLDASTDPERAPVRDHRAALARLAPLPTAELERLLVETLDTGAHRLDAWITSLAARRLAARRATAPTGIHLGGFGWVEDLRPRTAPLPGTAGGHIHAPSAAHATAAAILRSAHLTRTGAQRDRVAVELSSRRVRAALELVDGVRQGQPAGAVLGYRFERTLLDAALDVYIAPFRARFPLGRDPAAPPEAPGERIAARAVVNGLTLRAALGPDFTPTAVPWAALPAVATAHRPAVAACLAALDDAVDAAADLGLAEAVFQAAQGNVDRAAATLAGLSGTGDLPAPQLASSPRGGVTFTQRVALVLGEGDRGDDWPEGLRGRIEPRLDAWVAARLGHPKRAVGFLRYPDPLPGDPDHRGELRVQAIDLGLGPLDVLAMARVAGDGGPDELAARLRAYGLAQGLPGPIELDLARPPGAEREDLGLAELIELARGIDAMIRAARPLTAADLAPAGRKVQPALDTSGLDAIVDEVAEHVADAADAIDDGIAAAAGGELAPVRAALWTAVGLGVRAALPLDLDGTGDAARDVLVAQAARVRVELNRRETAADLSLPAAARIDALLGGTVPILVPFAPPDRGELDDAFAHGPSLVDDERQVRAWFTSAARVRPDLSPWRTVSLTAEAVGAPLDLAAVQLPHDGGARWIALPFDPSDPDRRPRAGTLSLAVHAAAELGVDTWSGLLLDEWTELVPSPTQDTAFAVHHDAPVAEAPQCVLLAVAPTAAPTWQLDALVETVHDALDLAKLRTVDADDLGPLGLLAPTTYLAANVAGDAIAVDLGLAVVADTVLSPPE